MINTKPKWEVNAFYKHAMDLWSKAIDTKEIMFIDMTEVYRREQEYMIKNGEIWIQQINAKMRGGKSTVAFAEGKSIFDIQKKMKWHKPEEEFGLKNIARDQDEKAEKMRNPKTEYTIIVTDEENALENTGENTSIEQAEAQMVSDVQASRYVSEINISPKGITNPNTDIILDVVSIDRKQMMTHCHLYYKWHEGGEDYTQLLGFVDISVKPIIKDWIKIKDKFYKPRKSKEDEELIKKYENKDWYTQYVIKKQQKMELLTLHKIKRPRTLKYAGVLLSVVEKLKRITESTGKLNKNWISNFIKIKMREANIPMSIVGEELATREVEGILSIYQNINELKINKSKIKKARKTGKLTDEEYIKRMEILTVAESDLTELINEQLNELINKKQLYEKYKGDIL